MRERGKEVEETILGDGYHFYWFCSMLYTRLNIYVQGQGQIMMVSRRKQIKHPQSAARR